MTGRGRCIGCAFLNQCETEEGIESTCQVINPGQRTVLDLEDDTGCPKWEQASLKASTQRKRSSREEPIIYDIIR